MTGRWIPSTRTCSISIHTAHTRSYAPGVPNCAAKVSGLALVPALSKYSERGMEYVNTLAGMIRVNELAAADNARLLDMPLLLIVDAASAEDTVKLTTEIEGMRESGELSGLIASMGIAID